MKRANEHDEKYQMRIKNRQRKNVVIPIGIATFLVSTYFILFRQVSIQKWTKIQESIPIQGVCFFIVYYKSFLLYKERSPPFQSEI